MSSVTPGDSSLTEAEVREVIDHYAVGCFVDLYPTRSGFVNTTAIVETEQGRFFLKQRHPSLRNVRLIRYQHALMGHLTHNGFPAPRVIRTCRGDTLLQVGLEVYELHEYIRGERFQQGREGHFRAVARTLAHFHELATTFEPQQRPSFNTLYDLEESCDLLKQVRARWQHAPDLDDVLSDLEESAQRLAAGLSKRGYGELSRLPIHGDFYADNLTFRDDRIVGVFDYDKVSEQARIVEIAETAIYFAATRNPQLRHSVYDGFIDPEQAGRFIRHYQEVVSLKDEEIQLLPLMIESIWLNVCLHRLLERAPRDASMAQMLLHEARLLVQWAENYADNLVAACDSV